MDPRIATMTDAALRKTQRHTEALCAFLDAVTRTADGERTRALAELNNRARMLLREVEKEYFARHPEAETAREQQQLRLCAGMLATRSREEFGTDKNAVTEEYFVEYNTPAPGQKTVTCRRLLPGAEEPETTKKVLQMTPVDPFFADFEDAMDEYAINLK